LNEFDVAQSLCRKFNSLGKAILTTCEEEEEKNKRRYREVLINTIYITKPINFIDNTRENNLKTKIENVRPP